MQIRALLRQGKNSAALSQYEKATDVLYRNLGIKPSDALRRLYVDIMRTNESLETDLGVHSGSVCARRWLSPVHLSVSMAFLKKPTA